MAEAATIKKMASGSQVQQCRIGTSGMLATENKRRSAMRVYFEVLVTIFSLIGTYIVLVPFTT